MHEHFFFYLSLSLILIHEMDAVRCKEWRIFPGLSLLNDRTGFRIFMIAHLPLFYFIFWRLTAYENNEVLITGLDIFFILHIGLHLIFLTHKRNEFKDWISWTIIISAGFFGLLDLL